MLHDCQEESRYPWHSGCLRKQASRAAVHPGIAFGGSTLWSHSAVYQLKHPFGALECIFLSGCSSLGIGLLATQHSLDLVKELIEIADSKGRSYGDTLLFFSPLKPTSDFDSSHRNTPSFYLKNVLKNEAATFLLWKPNEETELSVE